MTTKCIGLGIKTKKQKSEAFWCAVSGSIEQYLKQDCPQANFQIVILRKEVN